MKLPAPATIAQPNAYAQRLAAYVAAHLAAVMGALGFTVRQEVPSEHLPGMEEFARRRAMHDMQYGGTSWHSPIGAHHRRNAAKRAQHRARVGRR